MAQHILYQFVIWPYKSKGMVQVVKVSGMVNNVRCGVVQADLWHLFLCKKEKCNGYNGKA